MVAALLISQRLVTASQVHRKILAVLVSALSYILLSFFWEF